MSAKEIIFPLISFLHDLFTAIWIGGMFTLGVSVLPAIKKNLGSGPQTKKLAKEIQKKHSLWVYISMFGLVITGILMSNRSPDFYSLFSFQNVFSTVLSVKHILVLIVIGISLFRTLVLGSNKRQPSPQGEKLNGILLLVNIFLGTGVLLLSAIIASWI
jgi:uncharacterized membrane protein